MRPFAKAQALYNSAITINVSQVFVSVLFCAFSFLFFSSSARSFSSAEGPVDVDPQKMVQRYREVSQQKIAQFCDFCLFSSSSVLLVLLLFASSSSSLVLGSVRSSSASSEGSADVDPQKMIQRYREVSRQKIAEFREVCLLLTGWRIDMDPKISARYKVFNVFLENKEEKDFLQFQMDGKYDNDEDGKSNERKEREKDRRRKELRREPREGRRVWIGTVKEAWMPRMEKRDLG